MVRFGPAGALTWGKIISAVYPTLMFPQKRLYLCHIQFWAFEQLPRLMTLECMNVDHSFPQDPYMTSSWPLFGFGPAPLDPSFKVVHLDLDPIF
jgi:hypothetical protein